ncbi:MAG TPA: carboxypeptidase regulatory-like domain-containing protein [Candidatus Sulfotelmatobacter sp.]|nr:carboxypeptidase regulatory-like domain-containing protein [Candidatus Sulfotelmatobacter sp.]
MDIPKGWSKMLNLNSSRASMRFSFLFALVATFALLTAAAFAQTTISTGSIVGTVTDTSGAVVQGAKVTITGPTGQILSATSNPQGGYSVGDLIPGAYKIRIEAKGFKTVQMPVEVRVNNTANGNAKLEVGQESTVVDVQASEVQVNTEQATVQGVLTSSQIENLPVNGRNFLDLAQLEPGVQIQDGANFDPTKVGFSSISFGGRFGRTARINVDGIDVSDETVGTTTEDIPASGIQEFSLAQSTLDLSNDLTSSGAVNVTTKSGTNTLHGEAFGQFRDSSVGSASLVEPWDTSTQSFIPAPFQRNQEGGNLGGPIIKDKLFFFVDGERTLQHLAAPIAESAPYDAYSGTFPAPFKENELMARVDYALTKSARMFGRFNYFDNSVFATFFPSSFQVYNNKDYTRNTVLGVDFNTGSITHSIRFSYLKFQNQIIDGTRGTSVPFANYPVSINIGSFSVGPNLLVPQQTPQSDHELKYDGTKVVGKHILRFGASWNHIQGGGFASFFKLDPQVFTAPGPNGDPTSASLGNGVVIVGNGQGFSTTQPALGFPAGGLGPDNRVGIYFGDTWKIRPNLTLSPGLRWERDTGRTDSDLPAIPEINAAFPGFGNAVRQPNDDFAPQLGLAWDPKGNGKTVIRAGIGLYYENVIFNNVLFDRPLRERNGAFLATPTVCAFGTALPVAGFETVDQYANNTGPSICGETVAQAAPTLAAYEAAYQAATPFSLTNPNPNFIGTQLASGLNIGTALFAPNYRTPRSVQMNLGFQHEIRRGMVLSADFLRNVETHSLLGIDVNHAGAARTFNSAGARAAMAATESACNHPGDLPGTISDCSALNGFGAGGAPIGATIANFASFGMGSPADLGQSCLAALGYPCAFPGLNPAYGATSFLEPISRSVYNALQMKLVDNVANPIRGLKNANFQVSYSLSRLVNPLAFQGNTPPSPPAGANDQDFVLTAADNDNPLRYMGPSLLDRTHQLSFGGNFDAPYGFSFGIIAHFYSPLSMPTIVGNTGSPGNIFQTDFTGSGVVSDPVPGTKNGAFGRTYTNTAQLNRLISTYNTTVAGQPTPAGQELVSAGLFTPQQLAQIGAVAPTLAPAPADQLLFPWVKAFDFRLGWSHTFADRVKVEPSIGFFNIFNFANFNLPPGTMDGWLNAGTSSINSVHTMIQPGETGPEANTYRVGVGTGVFGLGSPRVTEFGLKISF